MNIQRNRPHSVLLDISDHRWAGDGPYWNLRGNGGLLSTGRDMFRWHLALEGNEVLDERAKDKLFQPHVLEQPGGDSHYGYGWVVMRSNGVERVAWHNGGNGWSYGELTRLLDLGVTVLWITNRYRHKAMGWDFYELGPKLMQGIADRVRAAS